MNISELSSHRGLTGDLTCPRCNTPLLPNATFCSSCGERLDKKKDLSSLLQEEQDITARYRITSLLRRRPCVNLYLALDNQQAGLGQQRMVAIRDIDVASLEGEARTLAIEIIQQEYDLLRHLHLPYVMPVVDLRYSQGHLFTVAAFAGGTGAGSTGQYTQYTNIQRLYSLQDFLQSGQGLPLEQQTLKWIWQLCRALDGLHNHQIVVGELDPYTVILNDDNDQAEPALMISWLLPQLRGLLPLSEASMTPMSYFSAPEALQGQAEPLSDIYSLGATLYLLLTGSPPGESMLRTRKRLRAPNELNSRISLHVNDCVMKALSIEPSERFQSAREMAEALYNPRFRFRRRLTTKLTQRGNQPQDVPAAREGDVETVRIVPLSQKHLARWQASRSQNAPQEQVRQQLPAPPGLAQQEEIEPEGQQQSLAQPPSTPLPVDASSEAQLEAPVEQREEELALDPQAPSEGEGTSLPPQISQSVPTPTWKRRITAMLPAIPLELLQKNRNTQTSAADPAERTSQNARVTAWLKQLQRMILGRQRPIIMAAAIVESPLRVQPNQVFTLRLHIMGRDEPLPTPEANTNDRFAGLSTLQHGDTTLIEVRSVLHQSYAYIVQQTTVTIPAAGYAAEVLIPIQLLSTAPGGRRDRLHLFFLDEQRRPLYERPFVLEIFVSHLVKPGKEGHQVLTIPV
jgi:serine/threonine protein kinase